MKKHFFMLLSLFSLTACWLPIKGPETTLPHRNNDLGMKFVQLPPGRFFMGYADVKPPQTENEKFYFKYAPFWSIGHQVTLTRAFWLQTTEVTQAQWRQVMGEEDRSQAQFWLDYLEFRKIDHFDPTQFRIDNVEIKKETSNFYLALGTWRWMMMRTSFANDYPVFNITWESAQRFLARLNAMGQGHYRLPTEAEWEYAARAGGRVHEIPVVIEHYDSADDAPAPQPKVNLSPVRLYPPNPWGLYDLYGGVSEMLSHGLESYASDTARIDPQGPHPQKVNQVGIRGYNFYSQDIKEPPNQPSSLGERTRISVCSPQKPDYQTCMKGFAHNSYFSVGLRLVWEPGS